MFKKLSRFAYVATLTGLITNSALAAPADLIGEVGYIDTKTLTFLGGKSYPLANGASKDLRSSYGSATQCFMPGDARTSCSTLAGVGFITKARVTLDNGVVMKVEVLEMKQ